MDGRKRKEIDKINDISAKRSKIADAHPEEIKVSQELKTSDEDILKRLYPDLTECPDVSGAGYTRLRAFSEWEKRKEFKGAIIFDFDGTLTNHYLSCIENKPVFIFKKPTQDILEAAHANNFLVIIATARPFLSAKDSMKEKLSVIMALQELDPKQIISMVFYTNAQTKDRVIRFVYDNFGIPFKNMLFADDDIFGVEPVAQMGVNIIYASPSGRHINPLRKVFNLSPVYYREEIRCGDFGYTKLRRTQLHDLECKKLLVFGFNDVIIHRTTHEFIRHQDMLNILNEAVKKGFSIIVCTSHQQEFLTQHDHPCHILRKIDEWDPLSLLSYVYFTGFLVESHFCCKGKGDAIHFAADLCNVKPQEVIVVDVAKYFDGLNKEFKCIEAKADGSHVDTLRARINSVELKKEDVPSPLVKLSMLTQNSLQAAQFAPRDCNQYATNFSLK